MSLAMLGRDDQFAHRRADRLVPSPAKDLFGSIVPDNHHSLFVHSNDSVERTLEKGFQMLQRLTFLVSVSIPLLMPTRTPAINCCAFLCLIRTT
jgi:hypothetical protein